MANLKDLKTRINSVKSTQKITKAMQMVAAAKLRRAQEAAEAGRPYVARMSAVMANLRASLGEDISGAPALLAGTGKEDTHLLVVATAERGLCGGFNSSIAKLAREQANKLLAEGKTVKIICVGKKGHDALKRQYAANIIELVELKGLKSIAFSDVQPIAHQVTALFEDGAFDVCTLFFSRFESVISQIPTAQRIIPASFDAAEGETLDLQDAAYEYEPEAEDILAELLPRNLAVQIYAAVLENGASEQGARMSAMDNATRNAGEMIDKLTLTYNRQRQANITSELIEIISGAEAL